MLREYTDNLHLEGAARWAPWAGRTRLGGVPVLGRVARLAWRCPVDRVRSAVGDDSLTPGELVNRSWLRQRPRDCDVVVATYPELVTFGFPDLHGKTVITSAVTDARRLADLDQDVDLVLDSTPQRSNTSTSPPCRR